MLQVAMEMVSMCTGLLGEEGHVSASGDTISYQLFWSMIQLISRNQRAVYASGDTAL